MADTIVVQPVVNEVTVTAQGALTVAAPGPQGQQGAQGAKGDTGNAATVSVGSTTTGAAGTSATVTNTGTSSAAVFNFTIPQGAKGDTGATGASGIPAVFPMLSGNYYRPIGIFSATASTNGTMTLSPIYVPTSTTFNQLAVLPNTVTTAGTARVGIYANNNGVPGSLILDAGSVSVSTSSTVATVTVSQVLTQGWYWLACAPQTGSYLLYGPTNSTGGNGFAQYGSARALGVTTALAAQNGMSYTLTGVAGALPSDVSTATLGNTANQIFPCPLIRVA